MDAFRKYFSSEFLEQLSESQPNWGVNVLTVGHHIHPAEKAYPDVDHPNQYIFNWEKGRVLNEYQLIYLAAGYGVFEAEHVGRVEVEAGTVFLLYPGIWHRYRPVPGTCWEEYWVGFSGHYAEYLMSQECFNPGNPLIHLGFNSDFLSIFIRLLDTIKFQGLAFSQLSSCLTIQLLGLVYASALLKERVPNRKEQIINNLRYKMHESGALNIKTEDLAAQHNVSYVWFRKAFKEVTGISPGQYQLNLKLEKASQMLKETSMMVSEISFLVGFESEYHFSRIFKKKFNFSPSKYRDNHKSSTKS